MGSYERQVDSNLDYLLCLHNQQVTSLNNHANMLNLLADDLDVLRSSQVRMGQTSATNEPAANILIREVITKYAAISEENSQLSAQVAALEKRLAVLEGIASSETQ
jgi:hypothetical protein